MIYLSFIILIFEIISSDGAAIGIEISGKSRYWLKYNCESKLQPKGNMTLILLHCTSSVKTDVKIPEESTYQCLTTVKDPRERLVMFYN